MTNPVNLVTERGKTHGDFTHHAKCTQDLLRVAMAQVNWDKLSDIQKEMLHMNFHKCGRILTGNPNHQDHYDDIAGYATLVSQRLNPDFQPIVPGTPEDGGHHARYAEPEPEEDELFTPPAKPERIYDGHQGAEPKFTPSLSVVDPLTGVVYWIIDRNHFSDGAVAHLAMLPQKLTRQGWMSFAPHYRGMYTTDPSTGDRYLATEYLAHWTRKPL